MTRFRLPLDRRFFDLERCVTSGQVFRWRKRPDGGWRGVEAGSHFEVSADGVLDSDAPESEVRALFDLDGPDPDVLVHDPALQEAGSEVQGLRLLRPRDPFETLLAFLCTPNNHLKRIELMIEALADGARLLGPQEVAHLQEAWLRERGFGYRARTIPAAAQRVVLEDEGLFERLKLLPRPVARAYLQTLPGVGPKLADCVALYGLHFRDSVPVDTHLWQAACRAYFPKWLNSSLTPARYEAIGDHLRARHGPHAGWAHLVLYHANRTRQSRSSRT